MTAGILWILLLSGIKHVRSKALLKPSDYNDDYEWEKSDEIDPLVRYITHTEMINMFRALEEHFPRVCHVYEIGKSVEGRSLLAIQLTDFEDEDDGLKPMVKYIGNMHGDEAVSRQMMIQLAIHLHIDYASGLLGYIIIEIHILPTMNPDGFSRSIEGKCDTIQVKGYYTRANANGIDLNRDFPLEAKIGNHQPETLAVMNWTLSNPFVLSANFHGGALLVSYLYDHSKSNKKEYSKSPDDELSQFLANIYATNHKTISRGDQCSPSDPQYITNGAEWYPFNGSLQDFTYMYSNCIDITVEISCCKHPKSSELRTFWADNKDALIELIKAVHMGVKGFVTDGDTGEPLRDVHIRVQGNGKITKTDSNGRFWRLLVPGHTYTLSFKAQGYQREVIKDLYVPYDKMWRMDVELFKANTR
ncbi:hypothetical protein ACOME3_006029 [Neoechinorhynchus agilis]